MRVFAWGLLTLVGTLLWPSWGIADQAAAPGKGDAKPSVSSSLSAQEIADGWIQLFDGKTFFGWKSNRTDINWKITDGVVSADKGSIGLLVTTTEFADYELRCDFRLEKGGNSGIFLRSLFDPRDPVTDCYELNTCDSHPQFPTGSLVGIAKPNQTVSGEGEWKTFRVKVLGNRIDVQLDGRPILSYTDPRSTARRRGFIGLQKNVGRSEFRNVFLRPLGTQPLIDGKEKELKGWRVVPGSKSTFALEEGAIHVRNGPGFLETTGSWGDFVLQSEVRTNGPRLNSGIFFRAMPGTEKTPSNGYELQIHNAWRDDHRHEPLDWGTGAIYRRVAARKVVPNDFEWFTMTLVAHGPHIATWVNGEQVADWTDSRPPHENPRKGQRVQPGHFSLQGHDQKTDVFFRNLRIEEFPPSR